MEIIPAILTNDTKELDEMLFLSEKIVKRVQIDIIDGVYAKNKTIDPLALKYIETNLEFDFQLMVQNPINWVEKCASVGADRIIGHVEMMENQSEFIQKVVFTASKVGLALDLGTAIAQIDESLLGDLDVVLLMSVPAGFGGQSFAENAFTKIEALAAVRIKGNYDFKICVDGGIGKDNIKKLFDLGVNEVAIGRSLFEGDIVKNHGLLLESINSF